ncbi:MAG: hypothetical protein HY321_20035 [Armatimonadetes bacterium]|nr:hypothetical protein [Armatimonadota bacterium]
MIRHNLRFKVLALLCAFSLWRMYGHPETEVRTSVALRVPVRAVNVPDNLEPTLLPSVIVPLQGPTAVADAMLAREDRGVSDVDARVDLAGRRPGTWDLPVLLDINAPGMELAGKVPLATISLEPVIRRELPVEVVPLGRVASGYRWEATNAEHGRAAVHGPQSVVDQVARLEARVSVHEAVADVERAVEIVAVDGGEKPLEHPNLRVSPRRARVLVQIARVLEYKVVPVRVALSGLPARGYQVARATAEPMVVTVSGGRGALDQVETVSTVPVDVSEASSAVVRQVPLLPPQDVRLVHAAAVRVKVFLAPEEVEER